MAGDDPELVGAQLMDAVKNIKPGLPAYAELSKEYHRELKEQGFDGKDALYLTAKFIEGIIFGKNK